MKFYLQSKEGKDLHTCAEFNTREEAYKNLEEYKKAYPWKYYYISTRACKTWKHDKMMMEFVRMDTMLTCVVRNNLTGGFVIFDNVSPSLLNTKTQIYGVQLERGERNPSGNTGISCRRVPMLDMERSTFADLYVNRFNKTEQHDLSFSYFIRSW